MMPLNTFLNFLFRIDLGRKDLGHKTDTFLEHAYFFEIDIGRKDLGRKTDIFYGTSLIFFKSQPLIISHEFAYEGKS